MSLADLLFAADVAGDTVRVHLGEQQTTQSELVELATGLVDQLAAAGVQPGQAVGVLLPNSATLIATLFAVLRAGAVYVPLNPRLPAPELAEVLGATRPAAVVTDQPDRFPGRVGTIAPSGDGTWQRNGDADPTADTHPDGVALVQFTSGTTGRPRPIELRAETVERLMAGVVKTVRGRRDRATATAKAPMPNLLPVSLSLWAGLYNVLFAFVVGAPVVLMDEFDTREFARLVHRYGIRSVILPPAALTMLTEDPAVDSLAPLRLVRSVSAPLSPLQARRFRDRFGAAVLNGYGQTELGGEVIGWSAADAREHGDDKLGSIGRPHDGIEVRVCDEDGAVRATDELGELWIRTPATARAVEPALADRVSPDGFVRTGDHARVDSDGFVWVEGRLSDMINRGGLKVFPAQVVEVLLLDPAIADAAVVGVPDDRLGEVPWAFVVATDDRPIDAGSVQARCRQHLAAYKVPVEVVAVPALPRNELGKVLTRELVARARGVPLDSFAKGGSATPRDAKPDGHAAAGTTRKDSDGRR